MLYVWRSLVHDYTHDDDDTDPCIVFQKVKAYNVRLPLVYGLGTGQHFLQVWICGVVWGSSWYRNVLRAIMR